MAMEARWVHGNAIVAETLYPALEQVQVTLRPGAAPLPYTDIVGLRRGWGVTYQGNKSHFNWFHAMIPTPVITNDARTRLERVFVLYETSPPVSVTTIHVWDGPDFIQQFDLAEGAGRGSHTRRSDDPQKPLFEFGVQHFEIRGEKPAVWYGIGISIRVEFSTERDMPATILFTGAGADFSY